METSSELPTPAQMRAFHGAKRAARQAVRMREASHALVPGILTLFVCLPGTSLFLGPHAPFVLIALIFGCLGLLVWAVRRIQGQRLRSVVHVSDRLDDELAARPRTVALRYVAMLLYSALCIMAWSFLRPHMSTATHLASLALFPLMCIGYFIHRAVRLAIWEYLLFALCIPMAYLPVFAQLRAAAPLSVLPWAIVSAASPILVLVGTASLYHRWEVWSRPLEDLDDEGVSS